MLRRHLLTSSRGIDWFTREDENGMAFEAVAETDAVTDRNKAEANHNDGYSQDRTLRRAARIPYIIGLKWLHEEGWWFEDPENHDRLVKKLNDPDWAHLRTAEGRIGYSNGIMR